MQEHAQQKMLLRLTATFCLLVHTFAEVTYLTALGSDLIMTVDNRDFLSHRLSFLYMVPPEITQEEVSLRFGSGSGEWLDAPDCPRVQLAKQLTYNSSVNGTQSLYHVDIDQFAEWMIQKPEHRGAFVSFCLFAFIGSLGEDELPPGRGESCLEVSFKVLDLSLPFTKISERICNRSISLQAGPDASAIEFESLTLGILPGYVQSQLECQRSSIYESGGDDSTENAQPHPELNTNPATLKRE